MLFLPLAFASSSISFFCTTPHMDEREKAFVLNPNHNFTLKLF